MSILVGIDPGCQNIGVVALNGKSDIPVFAEKLHFETTRLERDTHETWHMIGYELQESLEEIKNTLSPRTVLRILMLAPITKAKQNVRDHMKIHVATGIIYGNAQRCGIADMRTDQAVRRALHPLIGCPLKFEALNKKGKMVKSDKAKTDFVKKFWKECPNAHLADAWVAAKYLSVVN